VLNSVKHFTNKPRGANRNTLEHLQTLRLCISACLFTYIHKLTLYYTASLQWPITMTFLSLYFSYLSSSISSSWVTYVCCQHKPAVNVTSVCSDTRHDVTKQWRAEALPDAAHWINPPFSDWLDHNVDMSSFSSFEINGSWQNSLGALSPPTGVEFEALTDNGKERK